MKKNINNTVIWILLVLWGGAAEAANFSDNFNSPTFTNTHWIQLTPPLWDFVVIQGTDYGYHCTTGKVSRDDTQPDGASIAENGSAYLNAGLNITTTFRLDKSNITNWHHASVFFGFNDSDPNNPMGYSVGLEIDQENSQNEFQLEMDAIGAEIIPGQDHPVEVDVAITWDTFYTLQVIIGEDQKMNAYLYNDSSMLLGSIENIVPVLPTIGGKVGIKTGSEATFKSYEITGDYAQVEKESLLLNLIPSIIAAKQPKPPESCIKIYNEGIIIDGNFDDWVNINPILTDLVGDVFNNDFIDFKNVYLASDNTYLYVRFEMNNSLQEWRQANFDVAINFNQYSNTFISALFNGDPSTGYSNVCIDGTFTMTYPSSFATYSGNNVEFKVLLSDLTFPVEPGTSLTGYSVNHTNGVSDISTPIILCD